MTQPPRPRRAPGAPKQPGKPVMRIRPPRPAPVQDDTNLRETLKYLVIAEIVAPFGVKGGVKANVLSAYPERFAQLKEKVVYTAPGVDLKPDSPRTARQIVNVHMARGDKQVIFYFEGFTTVEAAETLRGQSVAVTLHDAVPLEEGEYYIFQLMGLDVYTTQGELLGKVTDVLELASNNVYEVKGATRTYLLPSIPDVVKKIDLAANRMDVEMIEGLADL